MSSTNKFKEFYKEEKTNLEKTINNYNANLSDNNPLINENINNFKILNSDGKLIRGTLVNIGYYLLKDDYQYSNNLALAYEIFQTAILIHDDIIDKDDKRRGKETIHYTNYNKYIKISSNEEEIKDLSNSIALCMGDYGLYLSNKVISDNYKDNPNLGLVLSYFNETVLNTIKGELLDVIIPFESKNDLISKNLLEDNIMDIYRLKTAYYTIIGPLVTGLLLAGADNNKIKEITNFGEKVGIAFQIQDDILGIYSNELGKVTGSDIKEFKQTILYSHTYNTDYKDELLKYYGSNNLDNNIINEVRDIFKKSSSLEYATNLMNSLYDESKDLLNRIDWINTDKKELLIGFVDYLKTRNK